MEIFSWLPGGPESLEDFNNRVAEFCEMDGSDVVDIISGLAGPAIVLSLAQADDLAFAPPMVMLPLVIPLAKDDLPRLEDKLGNLIEAIRQQDTPERMRVPIAVRTHVSDYTGTGYAVILVGIGELEPEEEVAAPGAQG